MRPTALSSLSCWTTARGACGQRHNPFVVSLSNHRGEPFGMLRTGLSNRERGMTGPGRVCGTMNGRTAQPVRGELVEPSR